MNGCCELWERKEHIKLESPAVAGRSIRMQDGKYVMDEDTLESALQTLSELLYRHYGQKVIILIDEYDVPRIRRIKTITIEKW